MTVASREWHQLVTRLARRFHYDLFGDEAIRFLYPAGGTQLEMFIKHSAREGKPAWIALGARLADEAGVQLETLLAHREPIGALCLVGTHYCVTHSLPLQGISDEHVAWTLQAIADATLRYRELLAPPQQDASNLAYLYE